MRLSSHHTDPKPAALLIMLQVSTAGFTQPTEDRLLHGRR
jgi:hypothetical protein